MRIDAKELFNEYGVAWKDRGKNISRGWVNLETCPFCHDSGYHFGIDPAKGGFHCWVCGTKGGIFRALLEMEEFKGRQIGPIINKYSKDEALYLPEADNSKFDSENKPKRYKCALPEGLLTDLPEPHAEYLRGRGFDPDFLSKKYRLMAVYNTGEIRHRFRIIVPVFISGKMVAYLGASVLRHRSDVIPYLNCQPEEAIRPVNQCLYNIDSVKDVAVIVEGVTDVWRCGDGFIATFRKGMTPEQVSLLIEKRPRKTVVLYDPDAEDQAKIVADRLALVLPDVSRFQLDEGDPGGLSFDEVRELRGLIF